MALEREIKLHIEPGFRLPSPAPLRKLGYSFVGTENLRATYWDTPELEIYRSGQALRYRANDHDQASWDFKGPAAADGAAVVREETQVAGTPDRIPAEMDRLIDPQFGLARVGPTLQLQTQRQHYVVDDRGQVLADMTVDEVTVCDADGRKAGEFQEIEIELTGDTDVSVVDELVKVLTAAGAVLDATPKYHRGLALLGRIAHSAL